MALVLNLTREERELLLEHPMRTYAWAMRLLMFFYDPRWREGQDLSFVLTDEAIECLTAAAQRDVRIGRFEPTLYWPDFTAKLAPVAAAWSAEAARLDGRASRFTERDAGPAPRKRDA